MIVAICVRLIEDEQEIERHIFRYSEAEELLKGFSDLRQQFPTGVFHTANFSVPTPKPADHEVPHGYYWCPYCADDMPFYRDSRFDVDRCITCGISDRDWHVGKHNDVRRVESGGDQE